MFNLQGNTENAAGQKDWRHIREGKVTWEHTGSKGKCRGQSTLTELINPCHFQVKNTHSPLFSLSPMGQFDAYCPFFCNVIL